jgi:hypothetical protein
MTTDTADSTTDHEVPAMTTTERAFTRPDRTTNSTGPRPAGGLAAVLRSEWIKATTVRANKVLLAKGNHVRQARLDG